MVAEFAVQREDQHLGGTRFSGDSDLRIETGRAVDAPPTDHDDATRMFAGRVGRRRDRCFERRASPAHTIKVSTRP